jgi:hypothetical protein
VEIGQDSDEPFGKSVLPGFHLIGRAPAAKWPCLADMRTAWSHSRSAAVRHGAGLRQTIRLPKKTPGMSSLRPPGQKGQLLGLDERSREIERSLGVR